MVGALHGVSLVPLGGASPGAGMGVSWVTAKVPKLVAGGSLYSSLWRGRRGRRKRGRGRGGEGGGDGAATRIHTCTHTHSLSWSRVFAVVGSCLFMDFFLNWGVSHSIV